MDIRKNGSYSIPVYLVTVGIVVVMAGGASLAGAPDTAEVLTTSYELTHNITTAEAESVVAKLEKALANCTDDYLAFRLRYRIAMIHFRAHRLEPSKAGFLQISQDPKCPEIVKVCSLNMIGQISRLMGNDKEALEAFDQTASLLAQKFSSGIEKAACSALKKLWILVLFSRAEIFEMQGDYASGIIEYENLLEVLSQNGKGQLSQYAAGVNDRLSQLYLRHGDTDKYVKAALALTAGCPEYYRAGIIKLEIECVKFLKAVGGDFDFSNGSFGAPAYTIAYLRRAIDLDSAQDMAEELDRLSREYAGSYSGILLGYHYAWLLDALGEEDKALEVLARASSDECFGANEKHCRTTIVETIQGYAKIQRAIILGEKANYSEALQVLDSLRTDQSESHVPELAEAVSKSIQTLKREVHRNEN